MYFTFVNYREEDAADKILAMEVSKARVELLKSKGLVLHVVTPIYADIAVVASL